MEYPFEEFEITIHGTTFIVAGVCELDMHHEPEQQESWGWDGGDPYIPESYSAEDVEAVEITVCYVYVGEDSIDLIQDDSKHPMRLWMEKYLTKYQHHLLDLANTDDNLIELARDD